MGTKWTCEKCIIFILLKVPNDGQWETWWVKIF
jgi:hypothetical protein